MGALDRFLEEGLASAKKAAAAKAAQDESPEAIRARQLTAVAERFAAIGRHVSEVDRIGRSDQAPAATAPARPTEAPAPERLDPAAAWAAHNAAARQPSPVAAPREPSPPGRVAQLYASAASFEHALSQLAGENAVLRDDNGRLTAENAHLRDLLEEYIDRDRLRRLAERRAAEEAHYAEQLEHEAREREREYRRMTGERTPGRSYGRPSTHDYDYDPYGSAPFDDFGYLEPHPPPHADPGPQPRGGTFAGDPAFEELRKRHGFGPTTDGLPRAPASTPQGPAAGSLFADSPGPKGGALPGSYVPGPLPGEWSDW